MVNAQKTGLKPRKGFAPGKRRLTAEQFDAVRPFMGRIAAARIEAARLTLVDDVPMATIAKYFGWSSRQTVSDAVNSVFEAKARYEQVRMLAGDAESTSPLGWELVTLIAPPTLITRWRKELANEFGRICAEVHNTQVKTDGRPRKRQTTIVAAAAALGQPIPLSPAAVGNVAGEVCEESD